MTRPARKMKPSGIPWIGDVPADWESRRFRRAGRFVKGKLPSNDNSNAEGLPIIGASEMNGKPPRTFTTDSSCPQCEKDDVLILWDGANAGFVAQGFAGTLSSTVVKYRCEIPETCPRYVFYLLKYFETYFRNKVNGTTIPHMNPAFIDDCALLLPPAETQKKIAEFLDEKCAEIDALIAVEEKMIAELKSYKQSVITEAVTRGVTAAANASRPLKDSGIPWLGSVPAHWEVKQISRISSVVRGASPRPAGDPQYFHGDFIPWITVAEVTKDDGKFIFETETFLTEAGMRNSRIVNSETLLLSNSGATLGVPKITKIRGCINDGSVAFLNLTESKEFLFYVLKSRTQELRLQMQGSGQPNLNTQIVKSMYVPVPTREEQNEIVNYLDKKCLEIDSTILLKQEKTTSLQNYKKSIIFEHVTGKC